MSYISKPGKLSIHHSGNMSVFFQACTWIYLIFFNFCSLYSWGHSIWKLVSKSHDLVLPLFPPLSKPFHLSVSLCHNIRVSISTCYIMISANIILDTDKLTQLSVSLFHNICVIYIYSLTVISANIILDTHTHKLTQLNISLYHNICVSFISTCCIVISNTAHRKLVPQHTCVIYIHLLHHD